MWPMSNKYTELYTEKKYICIEKPDQKNSFSSHRQCLAVSNDEKDGPVPHSTKTLQA